MSDLERAIGNLASVWKRAVVISLGLCVVLGGCQGQSGVLDPVLKKTVSDKDGAFSLTVPRSWHVKDYSEESEWEIEIGIFSDDSATAILVTRSPVPSSWRGREPLETLDMMVNQHMEVLRNEGATLPPDTPKKSLIPLVEGWTTVSILYTLAEERKAGVVNLSVVGDFGLQFHATFDLDKISNVAEMEELTAQAEEIQRTLRVDLDKWKS